MTIRNLDGFFAPTSIAVIGPSRHPEALLSALAKRLASLKQKLPLTLAGLNDQGDLSGLEGTHTASVDDIPQGAADLAIWLGAAEDTPDAIARLAGKSTRAILIQSSGFESWPQDLLDQCLTASREKCVRLIGPGSLGFAIPHLGLLPLLSADLPAAGDIAFLARSGAVMNATLSWAAAHQTGFSGIVSLGARMDVDVGDLIDYFARDYRTRAIVIHLEAISSPRKFLSAARAAARSKPVVVIRSGHRAPPSGLAYQTHAGRLATTDLVYDAAFRRSGMLRVADLDAMFEAVETLSRVRAQDLKAIALLSNSRSLASLATERLRESGVANARLSNETIDQLAPMLHQQIPQRYHDDPAYTGPLILQESLPPETLQKAIGILLRDPATDGVLTVNAPTAFTPLHALAEAIGTAAKDDKRRTGRRKAIVACLAGADLEAQAKLDAAKVPCFASPAQAARAVSYLAQDAEARDFLMALPPSLPEDFTPDTATARAIIEAAMAEGRSSLSPEEAAAILTAYQVPILETHLCTTAAEAGLAARALLGASGRCVVKLISPDLPFKSRIDGLRFGLETPEAAKAAAQELLDQTAKTYPNARITGVAVQPMLEDRHGLELYAGLAETPVFGPALVFGQGGTAVEELVDIAVELPPLNLHLADALIGRTRIARLIDGTSSRPALDRAALALTLVKLSQIASDLPEIRELDINPLVLQKDGMIALDARMTLGVPIHHPGRSGTSRLAISPYPKEWEGTLTVKDGQSVLVRPVRPEDEGLFRAFFQSVTPEDLRLRFFAPVKDFNHRFLAQLTQLDYARSMAFAAIDPATGKLLGVVRLHSDPDHKSGEYAVIVRSDLKGIGLGWALMKHIIRYAKADGIETIHGEVLKENTSMLSVCQALGFHVATSPDDPGIAHVTLPVSTELPAS